MHKGMMCPTWIVIFRFQELLRSVGLWNLKNLTSRQFSIFINIYCVLKAQGKFLKSLLKKYEVFCIHFGKPQKMRATRGKRMIGNSAKIADGRSQNNHSYFHSIIYLFEKTITNCNRNFFGAFVLIPFCTMHIDREFMNSDQKYSLPIFDRLIVLIVNMHSVG